MSDISHEEKEDSVVQWSSRERLCLASCVLENGEDNWSTVSDVMKSFVDTGRCLERYSSEKCAAQFTWMIKDFEKNQTIADDNENRLKLLDKYWREKRYKEITKENGEITSLISHIVSDLKLLKSGALDDQLWLLLDESQRQNDLFWQRHGERFMQILSAVAKSEEATSKGKAPGPKIAEVQDIPQNTDIVTSLKEAVKDGVRVEIDSVFLPSNVSGGSGGGGVDILTAKDNLPSKISPTKEQSLTVINTSEKQTSLTHSSRKIDSVPKSFFNPNNLLTSSAAGYFTLSSAITSHGSSTTTTTVSSVTLSAPTLSKLLEMPPSFAGKLPPLPVSPRAKSVTSVQHEKSPQKALFKHVGIPSTLEQGDSSIGKFVAINAGDNLKMEGKQLVIKPSDVSSLLSKTSEHTQVILKQVSPETPQSGGAILASTLQSDANRMMQAENTSKSLAKNVSVSVSPTKQEEIVTYFKPKEVNQKSRDDSPVNSISLEPLATLLVDKPKDNMGSPTLQKLTPIKSPVKSVEIKSDKSPDISNSQLSSKTMIIPTKVVQKPDILPFSGSILLHQPKDTSLTKTDPFTFDEISEKYSDKTKTFSRGIKRKRDGTADSNIVQMSSAANCIASDKVGKEAESRSVVSHIESETSNNVMCVSSVVKTSSTDNSASHEVPHIESTADKNVQLQKDVSITENIKQEIPFNSIHSKDTVEIAESKANSNIDTLPSISSQFDVKKSESDFDELIHDCLKPKAENDIKASKSPINTLIVDPLFELANPPDAKALKDGSSEKDGVYDFPSDEKSPDIKLRPRYSASNKGRRGGRLKMLDKSVKENSDTNDESSKEKLPAVVQTEKCIRKSTTSSSSMDMIEDESTTSSQDSEKDFSLQSNINKGTDDQYKSDVEDVFEKKTSELSNVGNSSLSKCILTVTKDADVNDLVSVTSKSPSVSASPTIVRGKESKSHWSPQSIDPTSQSSMVTPTTSDSDDSDNFEMSDDSTNPDAKQSKFKWTDRGSDNKYKAWKKSIGIVWREIANHRYANVFAQKVSDDIAPGYHNIVYRPMDLATIKRNVDSGAIKTTEDFQRDVMLMFQNAIMYNSSDHDVYNMAVEMQGDVFMQVQDLANQLTMQDENKESVTSVPRNVRQTKVLKPSQKPSSNRDSPA